MKKIIISNNKFKSIFISLNLLVPLKAEEMSKNALLSMVLEKACNKYKTEKELQKELAKLYNTKLRTKVEKLNGKYNIGFEIEMINKKYLEKDVLKEALNILNQVINHPLQTNERFDKDVFQREKENLVIKIKEQQDQKREYAFRKIEEFTFEQEDYGYPELGKESDVLMIDNASLYKHYLKLIKQADRILIVNGNLDGYENIEQRIDEVFPNTKENKPFEKKIDIPIKNMNKPIIKIEKQNINQSILCFGIRIYDLQEKEIFNMEIINLILGGTPSSRLFQNIREKESLAYYIKSIYDEQKGAIYIVSGIEPSSYSKAKELIIKEIKSIVTGKTTDEEIKIAKDQIISRYREIEDSKEATCRFILYNQILFSKTINIEQVIKDIKELKKQDIISLAKKLNVEKIFLLEGGNEN